MSDFRKIMICFNIVTFKRFRLKIVKFKQIIIKLKKNSYGLGINPFQNSYVSEFWTKKT